jgi:hypothetical protein
MVKFLRLCLVSALVCACVALSPSQLLASPSDIQFEPSLAFSPKLVCAQGRPAMFDGNVRSLVGYQAELRSKIQNASAALKTQKKKLKKLKAKKAQKKQIAKIKNVINESEKELQAIKLEESSVSSVCTSPAPISSSLTSGTLSLTGSSPASPIAINALPQSSSGHYLLKLLGSNLDRDMYLRVEVLSEAGAPRRTLILPFTFLDPQEIEVKLLSVAPVTTRFELFLIDPANNLLASGPLTIQFTQSSDECIDGVDNDGDGLTDTEDLGCTSPTDQSEGGKLTGEIENRWTVVEPASDTRKVYVSASSGNDAWSGLSPAAPKRTVSAARSLLRAGFPDWLLLKRGDDFTASTQQLFPMTSGRGLTEPTVIAPYGDVNLPAPKVLGGMVSAAGYSAISHLYILGLDFGSQGLGAHVGGTNLLIEGNQFKAPATAIDLQGYLAPASDYRVRNNKIDSTQNNAFFFKKVNGLEVFGNVIVNPSYGVLGNHAMYFTREGNTNVTVAENLVKNQKTHGNGIMLRPGGYASMNLLIGYGSSGLTFGACNDGTQPSCYPNNVVFHAEKNMFLGHYPLALIGCGTTIETQYIATGLVEKSIRVSAASSNCYAGPWGAPASYTEQNVLVTGNKSLSTATPLEAYQAVIGEVPTPQAFWANALASLKFRDIDERYTAEEIYAYLWAL